MKIKSSVFIKSFVQVPPFDLPILPSIAFIGRSNVGKSSLMNHLFSRKNLVKTSSTPGKTQLFNYFLVNETFYFIDLPGYGFAKVPENVKQLWVERIQTFLLTTSHLKLILQLVDIRHNLTQEDIYFNHLAKNSGTPVLIIANKADKLKKNQLVTSLQKIQNCLNITYTPIPHSKISKIGIKEILDQIKIHLS